MDMQLFQSLSNQELHILAEQSGVLICRYYMKTHVVESLFDFPLQRYGVKQIQENMPQYAVEQKVVSEDTVDIYLQFYENMHKGIPSGSIDVKLLVKDGEYRWHHGNYALVYDEKKQPLHAFITFSDNSEKIEMELAAEKWHANLSNLIAEAALYTELNLTKNTVVRLEGLPQYLPKQDTPQTFEQMIELGMWGEMDEATKEEYYAFFNRQRLFGLFLEDVTEDHFDYCFTQPSGVALWMRANVRMIRYPHSNDVIATIYFVKLDRRQRDWEQLSHKAFHDALTGIFNRDGIDKYSAEKFATYNPQETTALFMIDLDNFKQINDRLGHQVGDLVLKRVAQTLKESFLPTDIVGRLGGDEFIVLLSGEFHMGFLEKKALELLTSMKLPQGEGKELPISVSIGIAYGQGRLTFETLYRSADIALYTAKKAGKSRFHLINTDTNQEQSYRGVASESDLLSLQSLLSYTDHTTLLGQSRTPYKVLVDNVPGGVLVITLRQDTIQLTHCNDWAAQHFGYTMEEVTKEQEKTPLAFLHEDDWPMILKTIEAIKNGQDSISITYRTRHKNGTYFYVALNALVTERRQNEVIFYGIQTDVDDLIHIQQELEKSHKKMEALINAIPGGIAIFELGETVKITHFGNWVYQYCGYDEEKVPQHQQEYLDSIHKEALPDIILALDGVRRGADTFELAVPFRHKKGFSKRVNIRGSIIERTKEKITMYTIFTSGEQND